MVSSETRELVEAVLADMLVGQHFCRARFDATLSLYLCGPRPSGIGAWFGDSDDDAVSLHVWGGWKLFEATPSRWPRTEEDLPDLPMESLVSVACALRENVIVDARLGTESPHLIVTFDDGQVLFVGGHHDQYESWQLHAGRGKLLIVAVPRDDLAVWLPEGYRQT